MASAVLAASLAAMRSAVQVDTSSFAATIAAFAVATLAVAKEIGGARAVMGLECGRGGVSAGFFLGMKVDTENRVPTGIIARKKYLSHAEFNISGPLLRMLPTKALQVLASMASGRSRPPPDGSGGRDAGRLCRSGRP
jgi:hypothetical protein